MISRRTYLKLAMAAGASLAMRPGLLWAEDRKLELITRPIPSTGERLPGVGLGSSASFSSSACYASVTCCISCVSLLSGSARDARAASAARVSREAYSGGSCSAG